MILQVVQRSGKSAAEAEPFCHFVLLNGKRDRGWYETSSRSLRSESVPDALVTPDEVIGEGERDHLETQWNQRFRSGGAGRVVVAESALKVQLLQQSMGDLAALAEMGATKELIANAFHWPIAFLTTQTSNLVELEYRELEYLECPLYVPLYVPPLSVP